MISKKHETNIFSNKNNVFATSFLPVAPNLYIPIFISETTSFPICSFMYYSWMEQISVLHGFDNSRCKRLILSYQYLVFFCRNFVYFKPDISYFVIINRSIYDFLLSHIFACHMDLINLITLDNCYKCFTLICVTKFDNIFSNNSNFMYMKYDNLNL